jgi:hypothetical protein
MSDSDVIGDPDHDHLSDDEFAEAEHLARRALEWNKDDEEARRLWKLSRRGQGKSLASDLPETLRKEIYAEHALAVERRLYLTHDLTARLERAENPHDLVSASIQNATDEARSHIVSRYSITAFELDLILHEGEKESWPVKAMNSADGIEVTSSWYYARSDEKHVRQIVVRLTPETRSAPRVFSVTADPAFTVANWAVTVLLDSQSGAPVVFAKASGAIEMLDHKPADVVFAFYDLDHGGVFQVFVQVDSPEVRSKFGYPFVAEHARWLDETNDRRVVEALISSERVELCFVAASEQDPCTPFFGLTGILAPGCRERLHQEWDELRKHHDSIESRDFQSALEQYNQLNPMEESPVLPENEFIKDARTQPSQDQELSPETLGAFFQALSSTDVKEGDVLEIKQVGTVEVNTGELGLTEYDIVQLYQHGIRKVGGIELTPGVYEMAQTAIELGAERELSDLAADLIQQEQKKARKQKKKLVKQAAVKTAYVRRKRTPVEILRLVLIPALIAISLNLSALFLLQLSMRLYMLLNGCLIFAIGIYSAVRLDWAGQWPTKTKSDNPREELAGCVGGLFVIGLVLTILGGALKLGNTIMLPIVVVSFCVYGLFQLAVYPKLFKSLVLFTAISKLPEVAGSLLLSTGIQNSHLRPLNILWLSFAMPVYATWVGMITAGLLDWRRERKGVAYLETSDTETAIACSDDDARDRYQRGIENSERQNWKEAEKDFAAAVELDSGSPMYLYSLAVARTQCAPQDVSDAELQKYYLDVCGLFEKAVQLDAIRSELNKEAYEKVAYTCGAMYRSLQKHQDALRVFRIGLKHHPRDPVFLAGVGWSQFDLGEISEAEKTASQLLEVAPDSDDGRQLWKAVRKALGQELTSDLGEDLKRRIYKEYLQERDRSFVEGYMDSGVSPNLSFEQLVSDISGKAGDADLKVRRLLLEKYGLKEFEFELIVKQGEREAWSTE